MSTDVPALLDGYIREAVELRMLAELPPVTAAVADMQIALLDVRRRQDRVEELLRNSIRIKASARRAATAIAAIAEDAWDKAAMANRAAPVQRGDEFMSARERAAQANLLTLDQRRAARQAADISDVATEASEVLRTAYWGLSAVREDIREMLRTIVFESHLER